MANDKDQGIVAEALDQCEVDFERGLHSHGSPPPSVPKKVEIVRTLRGKLVDPFHANLNDGKQKWHGADGDGRRVTRMAFYLGAFAAFYADADGASYTVTQKHVTAALNYVRACCAQRNDSRGKYCDFRGPDEDEDQNQDQDKDPTEDQS